MNIDIGNDPISRIMKEEALYADDNFRLVIDREPIVSKHFLLISNANVPSFADLCFPWLLTSVFNQHNLQSLLGNIPWILLERGRARFCTSGLTNCHAHGHLLPLKSFNPGTINELRSATKALEFPTILSALYFVRNISSEYLMFSINAKTSYVKIFSPEMILEKRFIRSFLSARIDYAH